MALPTVDKPLEGTRKVTLGEKRVRTEFNPSNIGEVDQIKQRAAELINMIYTVSNKHMDAIEDLRGNGTTEYGELYGEISRCGTHAIDGIEQAAMWAVKLATLKTK